MLGENSIDARRVGRVSQIGRDLADILYRSTRIGQQRVDVLHGHLGLPGRIARTVEAAAVQAHARLAL